MTPRRSGVCIVKFKQILHIVLVFSLLTLNKQMLAGDVLKISQNPQKHK